MHTLGPNQIFTKSGIQVSGFSMRCLLKSETLFPMNQMVNFNKKSLHLAEKWQPKTLRRSAGLSVRGNP